MALLDVKPYDKQYYEEILKPFLPKRFIDCHAHVWLPEHNPVDRMRDGSQVKFTERYITPLVQRKIDQAEEEGVSAIILFCTGVLPCCLRH